MSYRPTHSAPRRGGVAANVLIFVVAHLMALLTVPVIAESGGGGTLARVGFMAALVVIPAALLYAVQRRSGAPAMPDVRPGAPRR